MTVIQISQINRFYSFFIEFKMTEDSTHISCRSKIRQQVQRQLKENMQKIDTLLSGISKIKKLSTLLKQCDEVLDEEQNQRQRKLIWKYESRLDYHFQPFHEEMSIITNEAGLVVVRVQSRNNWIEQYLDRKGVCVYGKLGGEDVKVIGESDGIVKFKKNNGRKEYETVFQIKLKQFTIHNKEVLVEFAANRYFYKLYNNLVRVYLQSPETLILEIKNHLSKQSQQIRRVLILRLEKIQQEQNLLQSRPGKAQQYRIYSGFYQDRDFIQEIQLPQGEYIFMPFPESQLSIYSQDLHQFDIVESKDRQPLKQLNLMLQAFPECHIENMKAEFIRQCDLDTGIIIQIYRNIYQNEICFKNAGKQQQEEDKRLMFQSLYSKRYQNYRLRTGETIVEFYEVTRKPAVLFQPHKKVIVDKDQDCEAQTIHSILR